MHYGLLWLVGVGVINSAISLYYYLKILKQIYLIEPKEASLLRPPGPVLVGLLVCAIAVVAFGVFPSGLIRLFDGLLAFLPYSPAAP